MMNNVIELSKVRDAKMNLLEQIAKRFAHNEIVIERMANKVAENRRRINDLRRLALIFLATNLLTWLFLAATINALITHTH